MILHYNIIKEMIDGDLHSHDRGLSDLIGVAQKTAIVTVWCPPRELCQRFRAARLRSHAGAPWQSRQRRKRRSGCWNCMTTPDA